MRPWCEQCRWIIIHDKVCDEQALWEATKGPLHINFPIYLSATCRRPQVLRHHKTTKRHVGTSHWVSILLKFQMRVQKGFLRKGHAHKHIFIKWEDGAWSTLLFIFTYESRFLRSATLDEQFVGLNLNKNFCLFEVATLNGLKIDSTIILILCACSSVCVRACQDSDLCFFLESHYFILLLLYCCCYYYYCFILFIILVPI